VELTLLRPFTLCFLCAASGLVAGLMGGMGGRRIATRALHQQVELLWDEIDVLQQRLARREGQAGRQRRLENEAKPSDVAEAEKLLAAAAARRPVLVDQQQPDLNALARQHFATKK